MGKRGWRFRRRFSPDLIDHPVVRFYTKKKIEAGLGGTGAPKPLLLDFGCGTWLYRELLAPYARTLVGVDLSRTMLDLGECGRTNGRDAHFVLQAEAGGLPLASESVDVAFCMDTIHHLEDAGRTIREVHRVLKPGGELVAVEINPLNPLALGYNMMFAAERGVLRVLPSRMRALLGECFGNVSLTYVQYVPFFLSLVPPFFLPAIDAWERWLSHRRGTAWAATYFVAKSRKGGRP